MLSKKSLRLAKTLVSNESVYIGIKPGSMLEEAAIRSMPVMAMNKPSLESYAEAVELVADTDNNGVDFHDSAITTAVDTIGPALIRQLSYVRKTVVPFISAVTDGLLDKLKGTEPKEFIVAQYNPSALSFNPAVLDMMKKYVAKGSAFKRIKNGPAKDDSEIIDSLRTGIAELDDALAEVIARDNLAVQTVYNILFCNGTAEPVNPLAVALSNMLKMNEDGLYELQLTDVTQVDFAIVAFFILSVYLEDPLPGTGLSLVEYQTSINQMRNQLGFLINRSLEWIGNNMRTGNLIMAMKGSRDLVFTTEESVITVFGPVYRQGLTQGLSAESLIGGALDPAGAQRLLGQQLTNKDRNLKRWQALELKRANYSRETFMRRVSGNFAVVALQKLEELPDDLFPVGYSKTAVIAAIVEEVSKTNNFFKRWNYTDEPNLFALVKQKVCQYIFTFIDAEEIIDTIESEMNDGGLEAPEAAYSAALRYLAKWLVANCDICEYKNAEVQGLVGSEILQ